MPELDTVALFVAELLQLLTDTFDATGLDSRTPFTTRYTSAVTVMVPPTDTLALVGFATST